MSTLKPEELVEIIRGVYGSNPATWPHTLPTFAAALEAELRKRWFTHCYMYHPMTGEKLYTAPHEQEPT